MIVNALAGKPLPVYGDGANVRDWLYVGDHCSAIRAVLERGRPGEVYNVGGNAEMRNLDVVNAICAALGKLRPGIDYAAQIAFVRDRPGHDRRYAIDARKIQRELGWSPAETFASGLERTVRWYLDSAQWLANVQSGDYQHWIAEQYAEAGK
jgi:dTDP-glucose 4,6-dehydratase